MKNNSRIQCNEELGIITIDTYNQKNMTWVEIAITKDNEMFDKFLRLFNNI